MKINLSKGSAGIIDESMKNGRCNVKLKWKTGMDLDLHALVRVGGRTQEVYFRNKGSLNTFPFVKLDQDAGIGNRAGDNEENLTISRINDIDEVLFFIDAFGHSQIDFAKYKPTLTIEFLSKEFVVDFSEAQSRGKYFVLARITKDKITNINRATMREPQMDVQFETVPDQELGFVAGVMSKIKNILGL
ncbi:MAG: hypothetical protein ACRDDH_11880 [Cetobacterium sp.]|uniref:hypothetical protein n=1 Tax=Cetobacterium sp. TaxID=2071632 RepID=UPI003EE7EE5E